MSPSGDVRIKVGTLNAPTGFNGNQKVSIEANGQTIWEGESGSIAELHFDSPTQVTVKYHLSLMHYGGECSGMADPAKSKKYSVSARQGIMSTKLAFQAVDVFDSD